MNGNDDGECKGQQSSCQHGNRGIEWHERQSEEQHHESTSGKSMTMIS